MHYSRRHFLKGAAVGVAGIATTGVLTACSGANQTTETGGQTSDKSAETAESSSGESSNQSWLGEAPIISDDQITNTIETDIVILGGGNSGSMCAFAAVENGASVAVIESQKEDTVFYYGLHDIASINSNYCLDQGVPEIKKGEFIAEYQRRTHNRSNPRLVKKFVDHSGEMVDWLIENAPQEVKDSTYIHNLNTNQEYFDEGSELNKFKCWRGSIQLNYQKTAPVLIERAETKGAKWYWGYTGIVLVIESTEINEKTETLDTNGAAAIVDNPISQISVTGVIAQDPDGNYVKFVGKKGVVLAGGDYGGNPQMYRSLQDEQRWLYESHGLDTSTMQCSGFGRDGSSIKMGLWAGGSMDPCARALVSPQVMYQSDNYTTNLLRWGAGFAEGQNPWGCPFVWMDNQGKRFTDETFLGVFGQLIRVERMKPGRYYAFFDKKWSDLMSRLSPEHFSLPVGVEGTVDLETVFASWVERGSQGAEVPEGSTVCAWGANTLNDLLEYMGFEDSVKSSIQDEIEKYNAYCENGEDEDFGRDPKMLLPVNEGPFYGMFSVEEKPMTGTVTLNGLVIDENQRVLDHHYNPILNLYATGNSSGGRFAVDYSTPMPGLTLGFAMTLGRVLGQELTAG